MTMNEHVNELDLPLSDHLVGGRYAMIYHRAGCEVIASPPYYQMEIPAMGAAAVGRPVGSSCAPRGRSWGA
jgi:hypothetical protein